MSGPGENGPPGDRPTSSSGRKPAPRSASPAKRSATDMERGQAKPEIAPSQLQAASSSFSAGEYDGPTDFDEAMSGMTAAGTGAETQGTEGTQLDSSFQSTHTSLMSLDSDTSQGQSMDGDGASLTAHKEPYSTQEIDRQARHVYELREKAGPVDEGTGRVLISNKWLARVLSRASENLKNSEYPKEARDGIVGPVDNSDIIAGGGLPEPLLNDPEKHSFIPLRPGLSIGEDFEVFPQQAYDFIIGQYGYTSKYPIIRYAHDSAPADALQENIIFELYPPTITIRKVPHAIPASDVTQPKSGGSLQALHQKRERETRGQQSPDDAVRLVSSRSERFQTFLARSKQAAGIPRTTKVRVWRLIDRERVAIEAASDRQPSITVSRPNSREPSPTKSATSSTKLVLDPEVFLKLDLGTDMERIDVQDETNNDKYNGKSTMELIGIFEDLTIVLEEQISSQAESQFRSDQFQTDSKRVSKLFNKKAASKPGSAPASGRASPAPGRILTRGRARRDGRTRGTIGLVNLGNSCYMNSALQCIRSVEELTTFFLSGAYKKEINNDNPLGHHGAIANSYSNVLKAIYSESSSGPFTPNEFKRKLGSVQPMFSGWGQQDSQEFLSFLVDALHEDLNRIKKKPYNENPDSDDKTVHDPQAIIELGEVYRNNHKARNDSVAMDLFSGFYKNTMVCPVCHKISITFDPYSLLTVQLPIETSFQHVVTFIPLSTRPVNHDIDVDKSMTIGGLKELIAHKHRGVRPDRLWMAEVYGHKIFKVFDDATAVAEAGIQPGDKIFLFELGGVPTNPASPKKFSHDPIPDMNSPEADCFAVPIFQRVKPAHGNTLGYTMHPLYITVTREEAKDYDIILKKVLVAVANVTSRPILKELEEDETSVEESGSGSRSDEEQPSAEDSAGVSDHSAQSEDGYVNVSLDKSGESVDLETQPNGAQVEAVAEPTPIPARFMHSDYFVSPVLRAQLFDLCYAQSSEGMHCASFNSVADQTIRPMHDRVKSDQRRSSIQSSGSDASATSNTQPDADAADVDESDADDSDKPDLILGGDSAISAPTIENSDDDDDDDLPVDPLQNRPARSGRRRAKKRGFKGNQHGKQNGVLARNVNRERGQYGAKRLENGFLVGGKTVPEDGTYYIRLGEGIVLDWNHDPFGAVFGGDPRDELRGHQLTKDDGSGAPVVTDADVAAKRQRRQERRRHGVDLEDCFAETGKREVLSADNAWYCNRCKEMRRAAKTLEIWTLPDILVVHLKRFGGSRAARDKIDVLVDYPIEGLDMTSKIGLKEPGMEYVYDLFAVDNHYGGLGGGHYTALAKNYYDGQWYDYNDSICSPVGSDAKLKSAAAYLLFYRRRSDRPLGPPYLQDLVHAAHYPPGLTDGATDDAGDDSDSNPGEGRLGGPPPASSHLGSSSGYPEAGVEGASTSSMRVGAPLLGAGGPLPAGASAPAASSLIPRETTTTTTNSNRGSGSVGLSRPQSFEYGDQGNQEWSFTSLSHPTPHHNDDEANSTAAEMDNDSAYGDSMGLDDDYADAPEYGLDARRGSPIEIISPRPVGEIAGELYEDDDALSRFHHGGGSGGAGFSDAAEHLETAGKHGADADPPPVDIHVEGADDGHIKID